MLLLLPLPLLPLLLLLLPLPLLLLPTACLVWLLVMHACLPGRHGV